MTYLFTSESVSEGHPDKVADQISDSILDNYLAFDSESRVACETMVTSNRTIISGEVRSKANVDADSITRNIINEIGYTETDYNFDSQTCEITVLLHEQTPDISRGVDRGDKSKQGAGDQGIMFGYATNESDNFIPLTLDISHKIVQELAELRKENDAMNYLRPDSKSQVTIEYDSETNKPIRIVSIVVSTQHDEFYSDDEIMSEQISHDIINILMPRVKESFNSKIQSLFNDDIQYHINPTGKFVIGGPHGDTGLTGRKIIVDTYGGRGAHGGGAFSGKDTSKVDRSAAYATRHIAKNLVASGVANEVLVQVSYAIGVVDPISILVNTNNTSNIDMSDSDISKKVSEIFDMKPYAIETRLKLREPIYTETATYGHMGRDPKIVTKTFVDKDGKEIIKEVELFTWEKLDYIGKIKKAFNIQ